MEYVRNLFALRGPEYHCVNSAHVLRMIENLGLIGF